MNKNLILFAIIFFALFINIKETHSQVEQSGYLQVYLANYLNDFTRVYDQEEEVGELWFKADTDNLIWWIVEWPKQTIVINPFSKNERSIDGGVRNQGYSMSFSPGSYSGRIHYSFKIQQDNPGGSITTITKPGRHWDADEFIDFLINPGQLTRVTINPDFQTKKISALIEYR